ncbi:MAG: putative membrane protein [Phormidesmis priestleyi Ana]|uniref:Putative membrane protein n=1 Tax=Phormidesmis priestleyi Ana TaxID=1666911 RepID=A0A0N8KNM4_9CYAN|nr:MAG: putative membrane protein [Phormidesmis priestleyi Ana]
MPLDLNNWILAAYHAFNRSLGFMLWNTFLALIPWVLSLWLFRRREVATSGNSTASSAPSLIWWMGLAAFVAFLPNAPYVLTDVIHLVKFIQQGAALWTIVFVLIPQYFVFMFIGVEAYVLSLLNLGKYLRQQGKQHWITGAELTLHALCALGIYLGRVPRFNSWDLLTHPGQIVSFVTRDLWQPQALAFIVTTFGVILVVYWALKHLSLAMKLYLKALSHQQSVDAL